jgi:hypothetical protein
MDRQDAKDALLAVSLSRSPFVDDPRRRNSSATTLTVFGVTVIDGA